MTDTQILAALKAQIEGGYIRCTWVGSKDDSKPGVFQIGLASTDAGTGRTKVDFEITATYLAPVEDRDNADMCEARYLRVS